MPDRLCELANHLESQTAEVVVRWQRVCEVDDQMAVVSKLTRAEFRDNIPGAIVGLCRILRLGSNEAIFEAIRDEVAKHGHHRWKQGFSLQQLIRDWGNLNRVLLAMTAEFLEPRAPEAGGETEAFDRLGAFWTEAVSGSVRRFDELRRAEAASLSSDLKVAKETFDTLTRARGQLLREAAHDIRGGLSAIAGASAVLKQTQQPNDSLNSILDALDQGVGSVEHMLNSLLDLSRLESGADSVELLSVNIADVLGQLASEHSVAAAEKGVALSAVGPKNLVVSTDPDKVRRIAQNLLTNALQHTPHGEVRLSWSKTPDSWRLNVRDTGPGMQDVLGSPVAKEMNDPPSHDGHDPNEVSQTYRGEGIGLTIVKRLCDLLDAGVSLESELGRGTTFAVVFPLEYGEAP